MRGRIASVALYAMYLASGPVLAFDSGEHCATANLAAAIAFDYAESHAKNSSVRMELERAREVMNPSYQFCFPASWYRPGDVKFSYGKVTALVDYVANPADLFLRYGIVKQTITGPDDLSAAYFARNVRLFGRFSIATHNNVQHFQGLLLSSFKVWHDSALATADRHGDMVEALVRSAIADHYLEDFFAPGHMITPRDGLPDVIALSWHDHYNKIGIPVVVRNWQKLKPIINFVLARTKSGRSTYDADFAHIADAAALRYPSQRVGLGSAISKLERSSAPRVTCPRDAGRHYRAFIELGSAGGSAGKSSSAVRVVCLYGDGMLDGHSRGTAASIPLQKALMVLVETHYILEVLDEYTTGIEQPEAPYTWCPRETSIDFDWHKSSHKESQTPQALSCLGELHRVAGLCRARRCGGALPPCRKRKSKERGGCAPLFAAPYARIDFVSYAIEPSNTPRTFAVFDPVFSLGTAFRVGKGAESGGALTWMIETLPYGIVGADDFLRDRRFRPAGVADLGLAVGYERAFQPSAAFRDAYTARLIWAIPRLDIQVSALVERVNVSAGARAISGWGFGGRFEVGFSFLTAFVGLSSDPTLVNGARENAAMLRAGVSFSFSGERAWNGLRHL